MYCLWPSMKAEYPKSTRNEGIRTQKRKEIGRDKHTSSNKGEEKHGCSKVARVRGGKGKQEDSE